MAPKTGSGFLGESGRVAGSVSPRPSARAEKVPHLLRTTREEDLSPPQAPRLLGKGSSASVTAEQCTFPPRDDYDDEGDISNELIQGTFLRSVDSAWLFVVVAP